MKQLSSALVIDIANDSISCSVVRFGDKSPIPFLTVKNPVPFQDGETPDRIVGDILTAIDKSVSDVQKALVTQGFTHRDDMPRKAFCVVHSPLLMSQTKIIRTSFAKPTLITRRLIDSLVETEKKNAIATAANVNEDLSVLEEHIISIQLNGYETASPYGKRAEEVSIFMHLSLIGKQILTDIQSKIHLHYQIPIEFHSMSLVFYTDVRDSNPFDQNFLLVSIDPLTSDVNIVKKGILVQTITFPIGKNFFIKKIADAQKVLPEIAVSAIRMHSQGMSTAEASSAIAPLLKDASADWQKAFADTLTNLSEELFIPRRVYLQADLEMLAFFEKMIASQDFRQFSTAKQDFKVSTMQDTTLVLESAFINKVYRS